MRPFKVGDRVLTADGNEGVIMEVQYSHHYPILVTFAGVVVGTPYDRIFTKEGYFIEHSPYHEYNIRLKYEVEEQSVLDALTGDINGR